MSRFYDRVMEGAEVACLRAWRAQLFRSLEGQVLEIGAGTGRALEAYPPAVERLWLAEPDPHMARLCEARVASSGVIVPREVQVIRVSANALPFDDDSLDGVVSSLVLCSVPDPERALREVRRVLRPGGRFVFLEHVAATRDTSRYAWQVRAEPVWKRLAGNCHLTRDTERLIEGAGFVIESVSRESIRKAMPLARPSVRGVATKPTG